MRNRFLWLASVSALAATFLIGPPALANRAVDPAPEIGSFTGAYLAARIAEDDNDMNSAIEYYRRALDFDPDNQELQQSLMTSLISTGRLDEALPLAEKLKSVAEVERFSRVTLAVDAIRKKDYRDAGDWLKLALESDLDRLITGLMSAWTKVGQNQGSEALNDLNVLQGPEWFELFTSYHRGLIAEASGMPDDAAASYQATLDNAASGSAAPETWLRSAEAFAGFLARKGDKTEALAVIDKADEIAAGRLPLMSLREKIEKGEKIPPLIVTPADGASEVLLDLGGALNRGGGEPYVKLYLQLALALKPNSDAVLLQLASVAEQQEDSDGAIELYKKIPEASPLKRAAEMQLGLNLADLKRYDEAIPHLKKLVAADPSDMRAYLSLGGVYASKEDFKSAAETYDQAAEHLKDPTSANWNIFYQRGIAYERLKQWPKAEPNFRKALELFPDQPQVMNYLGYSWVDMNLNLDEALDMIRKAVDLRPSDGYIVDSLGWAYFRLNRFDEAVVELERAVSLKPDDPVLNDHLGDAYWRAGRKLEATFQWAHARDLKPDPDVLLSVQKKLKEGLPPLEGKTALEAPTAPEPKQDPDKRG
jgi:tetratricopeptide (TPR) repeat protein